MWYAINSIAGRDFHPCCKARSLPTPSENGSDAKGSPQCAPTNTSYTQLTRFVARGPRASQC